MLCRVRGVPALRLIDNFDSFSCKLYQMVEELNPDIRVRNDKLSVSDIAALNPGRIIHSKYKEAAS